MAAHGKQGIELERYRARKLRAHKVSGLYVAGGKGNPVRLSLDAWAKKKRHRGGGKGGSLVHYQPFVCRGRARSVAS